MRRGPKPLPKNVRKFTGNTRKDRVNPNEPDLEITVPNPPGFLSAAEKTAFSEKAVQLAKMRVMTDADIDALAMYAVKFCTWKKALKVVRKEGLTMESRGALIQHPMLRIANDAQKEALRILTEFGMTPSSRTRVNAS